MRTAAAAAVKTRWSAAGKSRLNKKLRVRGVPEQRPSTSSRCCAGSGGEEALPSQAAKFLEAFVKSSSLEHPKARPAFSRREGTNAERPATRSVTAFLRSAALGAGMPLVTKATAPASKA